jgi:hypothetical protein
MTVAILPLPLGGCGCFEKWNVHRVGHFAIWTLQAFRFSKHLPDCPCDTHLVSWGKKTTQGFYAWQSPQQWALPESVCLSVCLKQPDVTNRRKYFFPATTSDRHNSLSLSCNNLWTTQVCMSLLSYNLWPAEGCIISNWSATMAFCPEGPQAACILCTRVIIIVSSTPSLLSVYFYI